MNIVREEKRQEKENAYVYNRMRSIDEKSVDAKQKKKYVNEAKNEWQRIEEEEKIVKERKNGETKIEGWSGNVSTCVLFRFYSF